MKNIHFFNRFNHAPTRYATVGKVSLTKQQYKGECDVNNVIKRLVAGDTSLVRGQGNYFDVSEIGDFAENLERVRHATDMFNALPSHIRSRFGNEPKSLVAFLLDERNRPEAERLGLVAPTPKELPPHPEPKKFVEIVSPQKKGSEDVHSTEELRT